MNIHLPEDVTLGILAGGQATRLGGIDKAWLHRDGVPQVLRWQAQFAHATCRVLVSSNRPGNPRWAQHGLTTVTDLHPACGPLSGLEALALACNSAWLFTLPVDLVEIPADALRALVAVAAGTGVAAEDRDGPQPLLALWNVMRLSKALPAAFDTGDYSVRRLQQRLQMRTYCWQGVRFGNLNRPDDLIAANVDLDGASLSP